MLFVAKHRPEQSCAVITALCRGAAQLAGMQFVVKGLSFNQLSPRERETDIFFYPSFLGEEGASSLFVYKNEALVNEFDIRNYPLFIFDIILSQIKIQYSNFTSKATTNPCLKAN